MLPTKNKATVLDLMDALSSSEACVLLDVRNSNQFSMCRLPRAFSLPLRGIIEQPDSAAVKIRGVMSGQNSVLFVLCRRGIDSRFATHLLLKLGFQNARDVTAASMHGVGTLIQHFQYTDLRLQKPTYSRLLLANQPPICLRLVLHVKHRK